MPRKKKVTIGTDVLGKAKKVTPSKVELTVKPPFPLDLIQLKLEWERKEKRKISEEEFKHMLEQYKRKRYEKKQRREPKPRRKAKPHV